MTDLGLQGKRVIVTGAGGGLGRAFALAFAQAGALVIAADVNADGAQETAAQITAANGIAWGQITDVTRTDSCSQLADTARSRMGGLDVLVNNAALYGTLQRRAFADIDEDVWDRVMAVNVKGVWQATRAAVPLIGAGGSVINIASATVLSGSPQWMHYVASKGAVIAMTRTLARELGDRGIRANVIAPGFTMTEASLGLMENARSYGVDRAALKRPLETEDITGAALWLASPLSGAMTGQTMVVDGGRQFI